MRLPKLFPILLSLLSFSAAAQVKTNFNNRVPIENRGLFNKNYRGQVDFELSARDINRLLDKEKGDSETSGDKPFRFADPAAVDLDIAKRIDWIVDSDYAYGSFTIKLSGAMSASINFDQFFLPDGTEMYIYNRSGNMITGPVTEKENNPEQIWGSWVYEGPFLTVELKTPDDTKEQLLLHSNNIAYGYKKVYDQVSGYGSSNQQCEINVICPLGAGWEAERNSVALVLSDNGSTWCSGAMIMNACSTNRPFFLTANHCYAANPTQNVAAWRFMFQAWSTTCANPGINSDGITYNGSTLRANWSGSDFCLVELNSTPPSNSGIQYAGWNRNTTGITQTTILHHPTGDVMKIARDVQPPVFNKHDGAQCWQLIVDNGTTEGGSSGGPYFDQNHRIIGQHKGISDGNLPVCQQVSKFGGRFDLSWTGGGTNATRLSNWLDPNGSNAMTTNTTNVSALSPAGLSLTGSSSSICTNGASSTYTLIGAPAGASITWSISNPYVASPASGTGNSFTLTKTGNGTIQVMASVNNTSCLLNNPVTKSIRLGTYATSEISFSPNSGPPYYSSKAPPYCAGTTVYFGLNANSVVEATNYQWYYSSNWQYVSGQGTRLLCLKANPSFFPSSGYVGVIVGNTCGNSPTMTPVYYAFQSNCSGLRLYTLSPNPASDEFTIAEQQSITLNKTEEVNPIEVSVIDQMQQTRLRKTFARSNHYKLNTSKLPLGVYIVRILDGLNVHTEKLIIRR